MPSVSLYKSLEVSGILCIWKYQVPYLLGFVSSILWSVVFTARRCLFIWFYAPLVAASSGKYCKCCWNSTANYAHHVWEYAIFEESYNVKIDCFFSSVFFLSLHTLFFQNDKAD